MEPRQALVESNVTPELYFLISKFLAAGPLKETAKVLVQELENQEVLPKRTDWLGNEHRQSFSELEQKYGHITPNHLLEICCRIGPLLDKEFTPSVPGIITLLGGGRQSLLRTKESIYRSRSLLDYCTRLHGASLPDSSITKPVHNIQRVLLGREYGGPVHRKLLVPTSIYSKTILLRRTVGHLSSVYCVLFDRTGRYIITGADDLLIKIWSAADGRLLATLRGASAEITDIAINLDNTMLAAGSLDRILRVWDMQTTSPIAVLPGHTGMITSVNFCPSPRTDLKYLVTTSTDGSIAFWSYSTPRGQKITFAPKPTQYHEKLRPGQAQMMCTTFSPGGILLAAGSADHHVRVYLMSEDGPKRILESEAYTDAVDSVQWAHRGLRFISGSKDGTAHIWTFESQQWKSVKLNMVDRLPSCPEHEEGKKLKVTMVAWDCSDKYVITAVNDFTIKIWNSKTAKLHCVLRGHRDELYVLESNPKDEHVLLSAGHDGQVFLWDIERGVSVAHFLNDIDGQGHGGVFDAKWSPDGTMIAATDSHGHILIFGLGIGPDKYKILPPELFFHTDYRPLLRDASHHVVDEQTQIMPHLMPPPFLVDADGNPHLAKFQRYVPGRENCPGDQLVPNLTVGADGLVVDDNSGGGPSGGDGPANYSHIDRLIAALANRQGVNAQANHSQLDRMIEALAHRQRQDQAPDSNNRPSGSRGNGLPAAAADAAANRNLNGRVLGEDNNGAAVSPRMAASWGRPPPELPAPPARSLSIEGSPQVVPFKYVRRIYVRPMRYPQLQQLKQTVYNAGQSEMQEYKREMRRRPIMISTANTMASAQSGSSRQRTTRSNGVNGGGSGGGGGGGQGGANRNARRRQTGRNGSAQPAYRTRAVRDQEIIDAPASHHEEELDEEESSASSGDTSYSNVEENLEDSSDESGTESSDYSDWVADKPGPNLEPPKRSKRKPLSRHRATFSEDSSDDTTEQQQAGGSSAKRSKRNKRVVIPPTAPNGEIPELYRPAEWLSEVIPRKAPYYPQMGDEVVYFRQGHHRYLEAVRTKKVYKLSHNSEPWTSRPMRDHEFVRVIGIKYEIRPPRLCCLKLAITDEEGNMTGTTFKIKYHDMPDVLDFLVLRQTYDLSVQRNWSIGNRFRCMIGDGWWIGQIESRHPLSSEFPDSSFMCFRVRWDNGEYEYMSPWDMEPIDESRLPDELGGAVAVLPEEIRATLYQPKSEEWHRGDRDGSCRRIINGLEQVMRLSIAEHFLAPVDLNIYPDYAYLIEYPIDLTTVKARFENHFYRRITSAQFDVRYLATNAEKYNRSHTIIVKHARIVTDLCLKVIGSRESADLDVAALYHQLVDMYQSSDSGNDNDSDVVPSTSTGPTTSAAARQNLSSTRRSNRIRSEGDWRSDCRQLLDILWQRPDSAPFREPVDTIEFPDYLEIISTPMDLRTVKEDLLGGNYENPLDFAKDVRLIFQNSKNYNTNKRSQIYSMTLRLSALFESHIKTVISNWKTARRRADKNAAGGSGGRNRGAGGRSSRRRNGAKATRRLLSSEDDDDEEEEPRHRTGGGGGGDDDDDDDDDDLDEGPRSSRQATRNGAATTSVATAASSSSSNRVTSSSSHRRNGAGGSVNTQPYAQPTRTSRRQAASQEPEDDDDDEEEEEEEEKHLPTEEDTSGNSSDSDGDTSSTSESSESHDDDDDNDDDDAGGHHRRRHRKRNATARSKKRESGDEDSEESYKPSRRRSGGKKRKKSSNHQQAKRRRRHTADEEHDDVDDDDEVRPQRRRAANRKQQAAGGGVARPPRRVGRSGDDANSSQVDESTQEHQPAGQQTPKKRGGRPAKRPTPHHDDGPSTSAAAHLQSPSKFTRNQVNGGSAAPSGRRAAVEDDHSYHLPTRNGRLAAESDTDSRERQSARPTRASVRRAIRDWARSSDVEAAEEEQSEEAEEILPTPTPTKTAGYNGAASSSRTSTAAGDSQSSRGLRTNRNTRICTTETGDDDDTSDNEPLASSQGSHTRTSPPSRSTPGRSGLRATNAPHPMLLQRRVGASSTPMTASRPQHMTRSHATSSTTATSTTTAAAATSSTSSTFATHDDHNYLGDQPSTSSAALRNSRRVLSRHQRNADELDISLDPLENTLLLAPTRLRRGMAATSTTPTQGGASRQEELSLRRGRSRPDTQPANARAREEPEEQPEEEEQEDDDDDESAVSDQGTDGSSSSEPDDDSEDNQPLTSYVPPALQTGGKGGRRAQRGGNRKHSDDEDDSHEDDDYAAAASRRRGGRPPTAETHRRRNSNAKEPLQNGRRRQRSRRHADDDGSADEQRFDSGRGSGRAARGSRNQKRPHYNEQSDDDDNNGHQRKRRRDVDAEQGERVSGSAPLLAVTSASSSQTRHISMAVAVAARNDFGGGSGEAAEPGALLGGSGDEEDDSDNEQLVSISSRGRVRKITAKARGIFKE